MITIVLNATFTQSERWAGRSSPCRPAGQATATVMMAGDPRSPDNVDHVRGMGIDVLVWAWREWNPAYSEALK